MSTRIEELYLEAESDIRNSNFQEAFQKYETILNDDPFYAPAHNSMGWIYKTQFENHEKAENHFRAAIKSDPFYPHPHFHLATIMMDMDRFRELEQHLDHCLDINTIDKSWVHDRFAMLHEVRGEFALAITSYEQAILTSMSNDKVKEFQSDIERCRVKIGIVQHNRPTWFKNLFK